MSSSEKGQPKTEPVRVVPPNMTRSDYRAAIRKLKKMQAKAEKASK